MKIYIEPKRDNENTSGTVLLQHLQET